MAEPNYPTAIVAKNAALRTKPPNYPELFASRMAGRAKQPLGDIFGLANFGVNRTTLAPGAVSSLRHMHSKQDEFVYILAGHPTLVSNAGQTPLAPGMTEIRGISYAIHFENIVESQRRTLQRQSL